MAGDLWRVTGGAGSGGIIVRRGSSRDCPAEAERLSTGAVVLLLECDARACRLRYKLLSGRGPPSGWVAAAAGGKALLEPMTREDAGRGGEAATATVRASESAQGSRIRGRRARGFVATGGAHALGGTCDGDIVRYSDFAPVRPSSAKLGSRLCDADVRGCAEDYQEPPEDVDNAFDIIEELHVADAVRERDNKAVRRALRAEFGIGWVAARMIPANFELASKLGCQLPPWGMCCVEFESSTGSLRLAQTHDPAASVNLGYLSVALEVRRREGREPVFSLEPKPADPEAPNLAQALQVKRFDPPWLEGTSVGEVMFQADVYLKELSMGEHPQPVVGLRSCLDIDLDFQSPGKPAAGKAAFDSWSGREWFMVRRAEVGISADGVLLPCVDLGVEAREQVQGEDGSWDDAPITRPDHPLVQYAQTFTRYVDLIAERRSVVFHLREVAKAAVLAKFVADAGVELEATWFALTDTCGGGCSTLEIPQLWNDCCYHEVQVDGGGSAGVEQVRHTSRRCLYGGVKFGLDRFRLTGLAQRADLLAVSDDQTIPYGPAPTMPMLPRGVDLNLDSFNLSAPSQRPAGARTQPHLLPGAAFWRHLEATSQDHPADLRLLQQVFNPYLSDRRCEGEHFVPPDVSSRHLDKLRRLAQEEAEVRLLRKAHFLSGAFSKGDVNRLFPLDWAPKFGISAGDAQTGEPDAGLSLQSLPEERRNLGHMLKTAKVSFDRSTEDGMRFRIYQLGNLEVRTTREVGDKEVVGAVFARKKDNAGSNARLCH